jgi:uncharacterized membrane protein
MHHPTDKELECTVARMLQVGVSMAALVVFAGGVLLLAHPLTHIADYTHFQTPNENLRTLSGITAAAIHLQPRAIVQFGLVLLIATPIVRVAFCLVGFARQRDKLYIGISSIVLVVLIYSLTRGAH